MAIQGSRNVTTSGTEVPLVASTVEALGRFCSRVTITAKTANTNNIYIGTSAVATSAFGVALEHDEAFTIGAATNSNPIDLSTIYIDADTNGEGVTFYGEQV